MNIQPSPLNLEKAKIFDSLIDPHPLNANTIKLNNTKKTINR